MRAAYLSWARCWCRFCLHVHNETATQAMRPRLTVHGSPAGQQSGDACKPKSLICNVRPVLLPLRLHVCRGWHVSGVVRAGMSERAFRLRVRRWDFHALFGEQNASGPQKRHLFCAPAYIVGPSLFFFDSNWHRYIESSHRLCSSCLWAGKASYDIHHD